MRHSSVSLDAMEVEDLSNLWWRHRQTLGLSSEYKDEENEVGQYLQRFFGRTFLPPDEILEFFEHHLKPIAPRRNKKIKQFHEYLLRTYLNIFSTEFALPSPNVGEIFFIVKTTTNACEAFHSQLQKNFYSPHPNLETFTKVLLRFQISSYIKMRSSSTGYSTTLMREAFVDRKMRDYEAGTINALVTHVSYKFLPH